MEYIDTTSKCKKCNERYSASMAYDRGVPNEYTRWSIQPVRYCPECGSHLTPFAPDRLRRSPLTRLANFISGLDEILVRIGGR